MQLATTAKPASTTRSRASWRRASPYADRDQVASRRPRQLRDGYARVENGEVFLRNVHIAPWAKSATDKHDPLRPRKLLLHKDEIGQLVGTIAQKGYTLVPLRMYIKHGRAKVELGIARGRKRFDKRQVIKEREATREMDAVIRRRVGRG